jgi:hypothetical protein
VGCVSREVRVFHDATLICVVIVAMRHFVPRADSSRLQGNVLSVRLGDAEVAAGHLSWCMRCQMLQCQCSSNGAVSQRLPLICDSFDHA